MVLAALGGRYLGPSLQVHAPTLLSRVSSTVSRTDIVVFIDDPLPDHATISVVEAMLDELGDEAALVRSVPATEAVKRLSSEGVVAEGIERSSLFSPRPPEIIRTPYLIEAVEYLGDEAWVCPSALIARLGARVRVFDEGLLQASH